MDIKEHQNYRRITSISPDIVFLIESYQPNRQQHEKLLKYVKNDIYQSWLATAKILKNISRSTHPQILTDITIVAMINTIGIRAVCKDYYIRLKYSENKYVPLPIDMVTSGIYEALQNQPPKSLQKLIHQKNVRDIVGRMRKFLPTISKNDDGSYVIQQPKEKPMTSNPIGPEKKPKTKPMREVTS